MAAVHEVAAVGGKGTLSKVTRHLGVDETAFRRQHRWVTNVADLNGGGELDIFEGRSAALLGEWLALAPSWWRDAVEVVAMDASAPFRAAVRTWLPNTVVVRDKFHALRLFHQAIDEIRRRSAWAIHRGRGRKVDNIWRSRHLLLKPMSGSLTANSSGSSLPWADRRILMVRLGTPTWSKSRLASSGLSHRLADGESSSRYLVTPRSPSSFAWATHT